MPINLVLRAEIGGSLKWEAHWPARLAEVVSSMFNKRPCLEVLGGGLMSWLGR